MLLWTTSRKNMLIDDSMISRKIIKPEDCVLAFGIPTTEKDFVEKQKQFDRGFSHIFAEKFGERALDEYIYQILNDLRTVEPVLTNLGLKVIHKLKLKEFGELFKHNKYDVIILFSHWENNAVEFADGFADETGILGQIPEAFSGIVDFCVCNPRPLTINLRIERPNCLIRYSKNPAMPFFWLYFYLVLFKHLKQQDKTYLEAMEDVVHEFSKKVRRKNAS